MRYITDTDFLPDYNSIQGDAYQIIYGALLQQSEEAIYDIFIKCLECCKPIVYRKSKLGLWLHIINEVLEKLRGYKQESESYMIYIPYMELKCPISTAIQRFIYIQSLVQGAMDIDVLEHLEDPDLGPWKLKKQETKTIPALPFLMRKSILGLSKLHNISLFKMQEIIMNEMIKRGLETSNDNSSIESEDLYIKLLLDEQHIENIDQTKIVNEDSQVSFERNLTEDIGFLHYSLKYYFEKLLNMKKTSIDGVLRDAVYTIGNGLFRPNEPLDRAEKSRNTIYQYVSKKKFEKSDATLNNIKLALKNCGIEIK